MPLLVVKRKCLREKDYELGQILSDPSRFSPTLQQNGGFAGEWLQISV